MGRYNNMTDEERAKSMETMSGVQKEFFLKIEALTETVAETGAALAGALAAPEPPDDAVLDDLSQAAAGTVIELWDVMVSEIHDPLFEYSDAFKLRRITSLCQSFTAVSESTEMLIELRYVPAPLRALLGGRLLRSLSER